MIRTLALALLGLALASQGCSNSSSEPTVGAATKATQDAEATEPPPPDFQESRRFSPARYSAMAKRLVPVGPSVERAAAALVETRLAAIERDFFVDDWLYRDGAMVLLGEERGRVVALTQRFYADIEYPDPKLIADGFGSAEIGPQFIDVYANRRACAHKQSKKAPECVSHRFRVRSRGSESVDVDTVESRSYDDHDVTLLYFHPRSPIVAGRPTLEIESPSEVVERHLRDAENLFGLHYNLVSDMSLAEMRKNIRVDSAGGRLLIMATGMLLSPVVSHLAGELVNQLSLPQELVDKIHRTVQKELGKQLAGGAELLLDDLEGSSEPVGRVALTPGLAAVEHVAALRLADEALDASGAVVLATSAGEQAPVLLAGVLQPDAAEERAQLLTYLKGIAGAEIARVDLRGEDDRLRSMVVIPGEKVNLNFELLRHGFVRLDTSDALTLRTFPELREAAAAAIDNATGFARDWRDDPAYTGAVRAAMEVEETRELANPSR
ncbi:MAG: hypothetical protein KC486_09965 [Myxococcales bacterium]|nr:hypothetical protein [Myxococcales bacterium]